jgi:hypothetical protein
MFVPHSANVVRVTDDYGRPVREDQTILEGGWLVEAYWANREDCLPERWWAPDGVTAEMHLRVLAATVDPHVLYGPHGRITVDLTRPGCVRSTGVAYSVVPETDEQTKARLLEVAMR